MIKQSATFEQDSVNDMRTKFKDLVLEQATAVIGNRSGTEAKKTWITTSILELMEERRKWKQQSTAEAKKEHRRLNNMLRRETERAKEAWWQEQCQELEQLSREGKQDQRCRKLKN